MQDCNVMVSGWYQHKNKCRCGESYYSLYGKCNKCGIDRLGKGEESIMGPLSGSCLILHFSCSLISVSIVSENLGIYNENPHQLDPLIIILPAMCMLH